MSKMELPGNSNSYMPQQPVASLVWDCGGGHVFHWQIFLELIKHNSGYTSETDRDTWPVPEKYQAFHAYMLNIPCMRT